MDLLNPTQKRFVSDLCRKHRIGMVDFKNNGMVEIFNYIPVIEKARIAFPNFKLYDSGKYQLLADRTDDQREVYWVEMLPDFGFEQCG